MSLIPSSNFFTDSCVDFVREQAKSLGLPVNVYEPVLKKPIVIITWEGLEPNLPSILLNGHMDVVPVYAVSKKLKLRKHCHQKATKKFLLF